MGDIGVPELLIILAIVIILFGPARIGGVGKSLGEAIRSFRHEIRDDNAPTAVAEQNESVAQASVPVRESSARAETTGALESSTNLAETTHD